MNHIPAESTQIIDTPIHDPSLAAILIALDFPLVRPRFAVQTVDLNSGTSKTIDHDSWVFGNSSPTNGDLATILRTYSQPFPRKPTELSPLLAAKLALHNRRCIKLLSQQGLPLHQLHIPHFTRLSSWPFGESQPVPEDTESILPRICNTDLVSLALTFGHSIASRAKYGDQHFFILQNNPAALYSLAEIEARFRDRAWIQANTCPLAVASAAVISFKHLFDAARSGATMFALHKNGRSALLHKNASEADKIAVARHLST